MGGCSAREAAMAATGEAQPCTPWPGMATGGAHARRCAVCCGHRRSGPGVVGARLHVGREGEGREMEEGGRPRPRPLRGPAVAAVVAVARVRREGGKESGE